LVKQRGTEAAVAEHRLKRSDSWGVLILAGGSSAERQVSLESGHAAAAELTRRGHRVRLADPASVPLTAVCCGIDVILPLVHGTGGEDGVLQRELDQLGIPWLGSSAQSSALTFSKAATRRVLAEAGLPIAEGGSLLEGCSDAEVSQLVSRLGYPLVVKPSEQGSSIGVTKVSCPGELPAALETAFTWGREAVLERWIAGREITVPVLDGELFPAVEILPGRQWFDYQAKYEDEGTRYCVSPAGLPAGLPAAVQRACAVCGVSAITRTDLRLAADGGFCILEINTIPGMTSHSLVPKSILAAGRSVGEVLEELLWRRMQRAAAGAAA
jgi:D-alanine-D-alanine ligase